MCILLYLIRLAAWLKYCNLSLCLRRRQTFMGIALHASFCQLELHKACALLVYDSMIVIMPAHCTPALGGTQILLWFEDLVSVASIQQTLLDSPSCLLDIEPAASIIYKISDQWTCNMPKHTTWQPLANQQQDMLSWVSGETNDTPSKPALHGLLALVAG